MEKHTPGPWTDKAIDESQWGIYDSRGWSIAQAHQIKVLSADLKQNERTANAKLIAAAPDLFQAAKLVLAWYEAESDHSKVPDFYERIAMCMASEDALRAAIKKATGAE